MSGLAFFGLVLVIGTLASLGLGKNYYTRNLNDNIHDGE